MVLENGLLLTSLSLYSCSELMLVVAKTHLKSCEDLLLCFGVLTTLKSSPQKKGVIFQGESSIAWTGASYCCKHFSHCTRFAAVMKVGSNQPTTNNDINTILGPGIGVRPFMLTLSSMPHLISVTPCIHLAPQWNLLLVEFHVMICSIISGLPLRSPFTIVKIRSLAQKL